MSITKPLLNQLSNEAIISIRNGYVEGIDILKRANSLKQFFFSGGNLLPPTIPILNNINIDFYKGDRIAFVGHNGSGKSSLLKTIAGIYPLKSGTITIKGQISAIIEMGLGFEPEMSGRDNIKLAMLFNRTIDKYTPELEAQIIEFSGLGEKIDWPLNIYSSGMLSRLAFASCIFQDPQILLLDEVFAAGDQEFLHKSKQTMLEKIDKVDVAILVSHQKEIVLETCNRAFCFDKGSIVAEGTPTEILDLYSKKI